MARITLLAALFTRRRPRRAPSGASRRLRPLLLLFFDAPRPNPAPPRPARPLAPIAGYERGLGR